MPPRSGLHDEPNISGQQPSAVLTRAGLTTIRSVPAWQDAIARHLDTTTLTAFADEPFHGRLRARDLDVVRLLHLDVPPHRLQGSPSTEGASYQFAQTVVAGLGGYLSDRRGRGRCCRTELRLGLRGRVYSVFRLQSVGESDLRVVM